eukprot:GHVN01028526.1.p1 GENE.GHVN01028526.1~~GHVN01028526.1.p1  ORF type:complete len:463 (-),score=170.11 GHVN01028526.1:160-1548(-)
MSVVISSPQNRSVVPHSPDSPNSPHSPRSPHSPHSTHSPRSPQSPQSTLSHHDVSTQPITHTPSSPPAHLTTSDVNLDNRVKGRSAPSRDRVSHSHVAAHHQGPPPTSPSRASHASRHPSPPQPNHTSHVSYQPHTSAVSHVSHHQATSPPHPYPSSQHQPSKKPQPTSINAQQSQTSPTKHSCDPAANSPNPVPVNQSHPHATHSPYTQTHTQKPQPQVTAVQKTQNVQQPPHSPHSVHSPHSIHSKHSARPSTTSTALVPMSRQADVELEERGVVTTTAVVSVLAKCKNILPKVKSILPAALSVTKKVCLCCCKKGEDQAGDEKGVEPGSEEGDVNFSGVRVSGLSLSGQGEWYRLGLIKCEEEMLKRLPSLNEFAHAQTWVELAKSACSEIKGLSQPRQVINLVSHLRGEVLNQFLTSNVITHTTSSSPSPSKVTSTDKLFLWLAPPVRGQGERVEYGG